ncbi:sulfatase [Candidatus Stoquefichus massiliensis]|uniref:sulfatase n=1 Tax=Candidatus Stoquefichus massiliensis TaxID=1470350 RepID=UPI000480E8FD|nr:sulfatase [Candidatus Stoquefichus massiliensis]
MKAIMVMFDTLTRNYLSTYGNDWCHTPNFKRLEEKCCVMDRFYGGSMPCMPARRELHTGKYNFLHRSWGPLEPFDFSVVEALSAAGIYTHLCTDHSHYFEDGGCTYHNRYSSWEGFRGQEGDRWIPRLNVQTPDVSKYGKKGISVTQHAANKLAQRVEEDMSSVKTFHAGMKFIEENKDNDNWFLTIESFDPHEPFYVPDKYRKMYDLPDEVELNWPAYMPMDDDLDVSALRKEYASLIAMCDTYLGKVLDMMDAYHMWDDTMLIVNTDHGFLLGEHNYLGKNFWPMHQEIIHIPFYIHVPKQSIGRRDALCQTIDIAPTLLDYFGLEKPENMEGKSLLPVVKENQKIHDYALFGMHGGHVNITDGDYVYMKASHDKTNQPFVECTLMPTQMRSFFPKDVLETMQIVDGDQLSHGIPYLKMRGKSYMQSYLFGNLLFDVREKEIQIDNQEIQNRLENAMIDMMKAVDAPQEEFKRLGLNH